MGDTNRSRRDRNPGTVGSPTDTEADDGRVAQASEPDDSGVPFDYHDILDHIDTPLFVTDAEGNLLHWNRAVQQLTGDSAREAKRKDEEHGLVGPAFYHDGRRSKTLAEKVAEAPERADAEFGVPRVEGVDYTLYADESVMKDASGEDRHISFSAAPLYDDGAFVGVVEMVWDRTEDALRQQQLQGLVGELQGTMAEVEQGNLSARVSVEETEYIDGELLDVTDSLNGMVGHLEGVVDDVAVSAQTLQSAAEDVTERSHQITEAVEHTAEGIRQVSDATDDQAASTEEIASMLDEATDSDWCVPPLERLPTVPRCPARGSGRPGPSPGWGPSPRRVRP